MKTREPKVINFTNAVRKYGIPVLTSREEAIELGIRYMGPNSETPIVTLLSKKDEDGEELGYFFTPVF